MLDLIWLAEIKTDNGTVVIPQFDDLKSQKGEHTFKEILDRQDKLVKFTLVNIHTNVAYVVNLLKGTFGITKYGSKELTLDDDMIRKNTYHYRLIYFRRVQKDFSLQLVQVSDTRITYFLGMQHNDEAGNNHKRVIQINADGRIVGS